MSEAFDVIAERQALAIVLDAPQEARDAFMATPVDSWTDWRHAEVARMVRTFYERDWPIDRRQFLKAVVDTTREGAPHNVDIMASVVTDLAVSPPPASSLGHYLDRVRTLGRLRGAQLATNLFQERVGRIAENRDEVAYGEAIKDLREALDDAERAFNPGASQMPMSLSELLDVDLDFDWLVPDLLERTDRLVLTGHEGKGKSELTAQFAACIAAGLHPFTGDPLPNRGREYKVLVVDAENSLPQLQRRYRRISTAINDLCEEHGLPTADWAKFRQRMIMRPDGVELGDPRELTRISNACEQASPDLLVIGPLYKLTDVDVTDAQGAKTLVSALDKLRVRHKCAVITEAHAGYASAAGGNRGVRPFGSSIFLRWPEFGYGLQASEGYERHERPKLVDMVPWRGSREERNWPTRLTRHVRLPWYPDNEQFWERAVGATRVAAA
jgi:hypothetical protein